MDSSEKLSKKSDKTPGLSNEFEHFDIAAINSNASDDHYLDQGYGMHLGQRIRLSHREISDLTKVLDNKFYPTPSPGVTHDYDIPSSITSSPGFTLNASDPANHHKLKNIPVTVEQFDGRVLVKIGPHDLSGVGGIRMREAIIQNLVAQALKRQCITKKYSDVDVCANISVRGRMQMLLGFFTKKDAGTHQNAYIKVAGEQSLTRWEPRNGPQSFFNDTICAMAATIMLALFEYGLKQKKISNSAQATRVILKSETIKDLFDAVLKRKKGRVEYLVDQVNASKDDILSSTNNKGYSPR